jgi:hypothetical protein
MLVPFYIYVLRHNLEFTIESFEDMKNRYLIQVHIYKFRRKIECVQL